jgi:hypothetical protein
MGCQVVKFNYFCSKDKNQVKRYFSLRARVILSLISERNLTKKYCCLSSKHHNPSGGVRSEEGGVGSE